MRKIILFFILTCLHVAARGQTIEGVDLSVLPKPTQAARLQYWFDDDIASLSSQTQVGGRHSIDVSSLLTGVHTIRYQIIDDKGKVGVPYSALFIKTAQCQLEANELRYWFNDDDKSAKRTSLQNGISTIDVSGIGVGLHTLHYQIFDSHNSPLYIASAMFMKTGESLGNETLRAERLLYWYDDEEELSNAELSSGIKMLDASHLSEGLHTLHYQVLCSNGSLTAASSVFFFRVNSDASTSKAKQLRYWYDDQTTALTASITNGTQMLDVSDLLAGIHVLHYQIVDESGALGVPSSTMFMKMDATELTTAKSQRYWFDEEDNMRECAVVNGVQELDVKNLEVGFHTLHYQLVDAAGNVTVPYSNIFMKTPECTLVDGKNAITRYQYWINEDTTLTTVDVAKPTSPYQLISLLPMPKAPIRSSRFHFEPKDGEPIIYAKNDVHFRFFDAAGYWGDVARSFVGYNVSQKVTNVTGLTSAQTFERPEENGIKWFKFEAEEGDSIAFYCSQATSLQVFAPSGEEIYSAAEYESVKYGGVHTWEEGTYYVAIHDVTGSGPSVTLNYMHMDKYDVVNQDVRVVGNGGCSTITFQGNGFKDLYAVDLYAANGDSIHSIDIGHESDASTSVTFDFTNAELGKYNAVFHFSEEDKEFVDVIIVEEAKEVELNNSMSFNESFLVGTDAVFTLKMVNNGNMTAYNVPVQIEVRASESIKNIQHIRVVSDRFKEYGNALFNYEDVDSLLLEVIKDNLPKFGSISDFFVLVDGNGEEYYRAEYLITLPPSSETILTTSVGCSQTTEVYFIVPSEWAAVSYKPLTSERRKARAKGKDAICCNKERIKCVANIANLIGSFTAYGCATSIANEIIEQTLDGMCPDEEQAKQSLKIKAKSIGWSIVNAGIDCVTWHFDGLAKNIRNVLKGLDGEISNVTKQISKLSTEREEAYQSFRKFRSKAEASSDNIETYNFWMDEADAALKKGQNLDKEIISLGKEKERLLTEQATKNKELMGIHDGLLNAIKGIRDAMGDMLKESSCYKAYKESKNNCPPPFPGGGESTPRNSCEPNDIRGYTSESGCHYMRNDVDEVTYIIDSENDPVFADAPAHTVIITDTINSKYYDLSSLNTRNITIGDVSMDLDGKEQNFIKTMDLRPRINVIAQVEQKYDAKTGIAKWIWTSLDPMTMEPTDDVMQGVLPVNDESHIGEGHITYRLKQKTGLPDGTEVTNQADIIFDSNEPVFTPVWTNTIDAVAPTSKVTDVELKNDSTFSIHFAGEDDRSGIWKYDVYYRWKTDMDWICIANGCDSTAFDKTAVAGYTYQFCVVATDSAGNVEQKSLTPEFEFSTSKPGDVNGDGKVTISDAVKLIDHCKAGNINDVPLGVWDVNDDGIVNMLDVVEIIKMLLDSAQTQDSKLRDGSAVMPIAKFRGYIDEENE